MRGNSSSLCRSRLFIAFLVALSLASAYGLLSRYAVTTPLIRTQVGITETYVASDLPAFEKVTSTAVANSLAALLARYTLVILGAVLGCTALLVALNLHGRSPS